VPTPVTVWAVELDRGSSLQDHQGTLSLEGGTLEFRPREDGRPTLRIRAADVTKLKRLRASPVLMVQHRNGERIQRTAFYFIQPPPIDPQPATLPTSPFSFGRTSKRRARRVNATYLGAGNRQKKLEVREWEGALRQVMERRGGTES
jgi:hypothetical protein